VLVDTNVVSELMRASPDPSVVKWAERQRRMHLSVVTVEEILYGLAPRRSSRLERWFDLFIDQHSNLVPRSSRVIFSKVSEPARMADSCSRVFVLFWRPGKGVAK